MQHHALLKLAATVNSLAHNTPKSSTSARGEFEAKAQNEPYWFQNRLQRPTT